MICHPLTFAHKELDLLLEGTAVTPTLSGLQISLLREGSLTENFVLGSSQLHTVEQPPLRYDHKIRVASISKLAVALGVFRLVEKGEIDLDREATEYLGWSLKNPAFPRSPIKLRYLLSHTSSVRDGSRYFIQAGKGKIQDFFDPKTRLWELGSHWTSNPKEKPGYYFAYSNLNFGLLAEIIERVSNQRFDIFMKNEVLTPLGLTASFNPCVISANQLATTYRKRDKAGFWKPKRSWLAQIDAGRPNCIYGSENLSDLQGFLSNYALGSNASLFSPQGGLRASASDLTVILKMLVNDGRVNGKRFLTARSVELLLQSNWKFNSELDNGLSSGESEPKRFGGGLMTDYGLSVHRIDMRAWGFEKGPQLLLGHLGEAYGVLSLALLDPHSKNGIAAIITGVSDDPSKFPGHSPLHRIQEEILRWWIRQGSAWRVRD